MTHPSRLFPAAKWAAPGPRVGAAPGAGFEPVEAALEDVYFSAMARHYSAAGDDRVLEAAR